MNASRLKQIVPTAYGDHVAVLVDGTEFAVSRRYRAQLEHLLKKLV